MRLSVGTNFDDRLPELLKGTQVEVFYGKMSADLVGGGRPTFALPQVDQQRVEEHVKAIHKHGFKFNYLLNATCLDNLETTREFNKQLHEMLDWLGELKVDYITVTIPMLIDVVRSALPNVKISLSTFANVNSIRQAKYFEDRGGAEITLPESRNRDFAFLKALRKNTSCDYQLIATNDCMFDCPLRHHHANFQSHASQSQHVSQGFALDYCMLRCTQHKMMHPEELIKSPWIRPEDVKVYTDLGYEKIKLTERMKKTEKIAETAKAYSQGSYDGNLLKLLNSRLSEEDFEIPDFSKNNNEKFVSPGKMSQVYRLIFSLHANIDNKRLDGFLQGFKNNNCGLLNCEQCGYCKSWADKTVEMDKNNLEVLKNFEEIFYELGTGGFFKMDRDQITNIVWEKEATSTFNQFMERKPEFIRAMAEVEIRKKAEAIAQEKGNAEVSSEDVAKANLACTPEEFRGFAISDLKALGFDPAKL